MKKILLVLSCALALAGCASRQYGSWLDDIGKLPNPRVAMSDEEARDLKAEAIELRAEANAIRIKLAAEKDRVQRYRYYSEIRKIDDSLAPIERRLTDAGRASRPGLLTPAS
jgi:hypothetical protein